MTNLNEVSEPEQILEYLLSKHIVFINNGWWNKEWPKDHITVHVNCNDVFAWASADSEDVLHEDLFVLFEMVKKDPDWGAAAFCIRKRKLMPQKPVEDIIRTAGIWNLEELTALDKEPVINIDKVIDEELNA